VRELGISAPKVKGGGGPGGNDTWGVVGLSTVPYSLVMLIITIDG